MAFSSSTGNLISGTGNPYFGGASQIFTWNVKKGKTIHKATGNEGYISNIVFDPNEPSFFTIGNAPSIKMWEEEKGIEKMAFIPVDSNHYVIISNDNYYTYTKNQHPYVHFVKGLKVYSFESFDLIYNRPDIILERLGSIENELIRAYKKAYERRLNKLNLQVKGLNDEINAPEVHIDNLDEIPLVYDQEKLTIKLTISDQEHPLERLKVSINNVPLLSKIGKEIGGSTQYSEEVVIPLSAGKNKIQVSALNGVGIESEKETLFIYSNYVPQKPSLYLVEVCVSEYKDSSFDLEYPVKDGKDLEAIFRDQSEHFSEIHKMQLFNETATKQRFEELREKLLLSGVNDHVVLFMAGHGVLDQNFDFYFGTHDMQFDDPSVNGISYDQIDAFLDGIPARKKLVLIDACHSGEIDKKEIEEVTVSLIESKENRKLRETNFDQVKKNVFKHYGISNISIEIMQDLFTNLSYGSGSIVIAAAAGNSYALESDKWENGVFTYAIKEAFQENQADKNSDGKVTISELQDFVIDFVYQETNGKQKPTIRQENIEFDFALF